MKHARTFTSDFWFNLCKRLQIQSCYSCQRSARSVEIKTSKQLRKIKWLLIGNTWPIWSFLVIALKLQSVPIGSGIYLRPSSLLHVCEPSKPSLVWVLHWLELGAYEQHFLPAHIFPSKANFGKKNSNVFNSYSNLVLTKLGYHSSMSSYDCT